MKTPLNNALAQRDVDFANHKPVNADLSGYAGTGVSWNSATKKLEATGAVDANTVTGTDIGLVGDGVTDNTTALQIWLNGVNTAKVNSTLIVDDGVYIFSGPLQDTSHVNAQIILPALPSGQREYSVTIKGRHSLSGSNIAVPFDMLACNGPIFKSTLATGGGTQPSFISGRSVGGLYDEITTIALTIENMIFETVQNPQITCLNLQRVSMVSLLGDVVVISGDNPVQPTTATSYGVILSQVNSTNLQIVDNLNVYNFYTGVLIGELAHINNLGSWNCINAVEFGNAYHMNLIERLLDYWCTNGIKVSDTTAFQIQQHDIERGSDAAWFSRVNDVDDAGNKAVGDITWWTVKTVSGIQNVYTVNGGTGLKIRRLGAVYP